jgi:regulator-associated protein of mTOR
MPSAATLVFHPLQMVLAAGGYDSSGTVRLFKAQPKRNRHHEDTQVNGNGH